MPYYLPTLGLLLRCRDDGRFPSPSCCRGAECAQERTGRVAVLTYLQGEAYLPLLQQLECTLRRQARS